MIITLAQAQLSASAMSSSFRRKRQEASPISGQRGTKAWTGGISLTSVGLRDLDAILGGGHPLGTCLLLEEDRWTCDLALCLIKYWCAEGVSHQQTLLIPYFEDDDVSIGILDSLTFNEEQSVPPSTSCPSKAQIQDLLDSLPRNLHWDKEDARFSQFELGKGIPLEMLEEETEEESAEEGLAIAWQYRKTVQEERLGISSSSMLRTTGAESFCHSFDLSGRMKEQRNTILDRASSELISCCNGVCRDYRSCGMTLFCHLVALTMNKLTTFNGRVIRLLLYQINPATMSVALPLFLAHIRQHEIPVVVLVTVQAWKCSSASALTSLRRTSDVVMQSEGFASRVVYPPPPEFRHLHGLLHLVKVSTVTAATANGGGHFADLTLNKRAAAHVYGLKRDRRKLHVPLLHIPPEDYAAGGSVSGGAVRSGAGKPKGKTATTGSCSSSGHGNAPLDF